MPTILRTDYPGAIHHVFARGNNKQDIFRDESDSSWFLARIKKLKAETDFKLYAFCLMTNHFHLLIETGRQSLAAVMGRLQSAYASRFSRKYATVGHVFQGPYGAKLCGRDAYFVRLVRYIHRNPVAAGLVELPGEWAWSGHRQLAHGFSGLIDEEMPLSFFGSEVLDARAAYRLFLDDGQDDANSDFGRELEGFEPARGLADLASDICRDHGMQLDQVRSGGRSRGLTPVKLELLNKALREGYAQIEVARFLGCTSAALTHLVRNNSTTQGCPKV